MEEPERKNATYLPPYSQNELIDVIGHLVIQQSILDEIREAGFYAIMADEVTCHNKEQLPVCIRFMDKFDNIREEFLEFIYLPGMNRATIANLNKWNLPIRQIHGQTYDGAKNMSGDTIGVQGRICQDAPLAIYTHGNSYVLNLVIVHSCKLPAIRNMIDKLIETCLLFNKSRKRQHLLRSII